MKKILIFAESLPNVRTNANPSDKAGKNLTWDNCVSWGS